MTGARKTKPRFHFRFTPPVEIAPRFPQPPTRRGKVENAKAHSESQTDTTFWARLRPAFTRVRVSILQIWSNGQRRLPAETRIPPAPAAEQKQHQKNNQYG